MFGALSLFAAEVSGGNGEETLGKYLRNPVLRAYSTSAETFEEGLAAYHDALLGV